MRKRIINLSSQTNESSEQGWLNLEHLIEVEVTSEEPHHPIEHALLSGQESGWRAEYPGEQTIRIVFDRPRRIKRIRLRFNETEIERTQEFALRWAGERDEQPREVVRQQYNFSPPNTTLEVENYEVDLDGLRILELRIIPDISGRNVCASLAQLRLA
jgi:hypothetical protein